MGACWEQRGCDAEMEERCPHSVEGIYSPCPADCCYTSCRLPQHAIATDLDVLLDPTADRNAPIKESCTFCAFFLTNGPRLTLEPSDN